MNRIFNMKRILFVLVLFLFGGMSYAQSPADSFFQQADAFLKANVSEGLIDYKGIKEEPSELNELVAQIAKMPMDEMSPDQKKAFYINSYNLLTIHSIIANRIPDSPLDIEGFFNKQKHTVAGMGLTLDGLEKETLFPAFPDARVHFVLVCAAKGCPPIRPYAYRPENLDQQIQEATVNTLNSDYFIRVKPEQDKVLVSEIFKWYESDFLKEANSVLAYINQFRSEKISSNAAVDYYTYDWSLNSQR